MHTFPDEAVLTNLPRHNNTTRYKTTAPAPARTTYLRLEVEPLVDVSDNVHGRLLTVQVKRQEVLLVRARRRVVPSLLHDLSTIGDSKIAEQRAKKKNLKDNINVLSAPNWSYSYELHLDTAPFACTTEYTTWN